MQVLQAGHPDMENLGFGVLKSRSGRRRGAGGSIEGDAVSETGSDYMS